MLITDAFMLWKHDLMHPGPTTPGVAEIQWKSMAHVPTGDHGLPAPVLSPANSTARVMEEHLLNQNTCLYSYHNSALLDPTCFEIIWARQ
jgi:hypothetical protein